MDPFRDRRFGPTAFWHRLDLFFISEDLLRDVKGAVACPILP
jgi:hypothetical protein